MAADLETFKRLYLCSLTSYGLITGLADFSFTERCYWYLQSALKPCLKAASLSVVWQAVCVKMFYAQTGTFFLKHVRVLLPHVRFKVRTYVWKLVRMCGS